MSSLKSDDVVVGPPLRGVMEHRYTMFKARKEAPQLTGPQPRPPPPPPSPRQNIACPVPACARRFQTVESLLHHMVIHPPGGLFFCPRCEESFRNALAFMIHHCQLHQTRVRSWC